MSWLREHALSGDRPRRGVCSPTATLAKQLEPRGSEVAAGVAASRLPGISEPLKVSVPGASRLAPSPARPLRSTPRRPQRRGRRPAPPGRGGPRGTRGARGARGTRRGSRAQVAGAGPAWRRQAGSPGPAVTAPRGAATHRLAPRPPPRRRSSLQPRAPRSPIYRLRGSRSGGRLPPSPPASPSARLRAPPLPAGPRGQPLSAAPLPPPPPGRAPPGLARAPDAVERADSCARRFPLPPPPSPAPPLRCGLAARCCHQRAPRAGPLGSPWLSACPQRSVGEEREPAEIGL